MDINSPHTQKHVVVLGVNHTCSKAELRDKLLFVRHNLETALEKLAGDPVILESLILSTCNRVEIYAVAEDPEKSRLQLLKFLSEFHSIPVSEFESHVYFYHCHKAVEHLFNVVSSLDSMIIGEDQILSQIKEAYRVAQHTGNTGTMLNKLFHFGIETGKRIRTETKISDGILSIASAAVDLAKKILGDLRQKTALVIGAGEMSSLTAKHLSAAGIKKMYFANRTLENARSMAEEFNGTAILLDRRGDVIADCDIIISSTGSPHFIIMQEEIKRVMSARKHQALFCIDIAAPRDIHPDVGRLQNVFLYTIDDLSQVVEGTSNMRRNEIDKAKAIIGEDIEKYYDWYNSLKVLPTLISLRKQFERMRDDELSKYASDISGLPQPAQELFRRFAETLTQKMLNTPSRVIKEVASDRDSVVLTQSLATIFDLKVGSK